LVFDSRRCRRYPTDLRRRSIIGSASEPTSNFFRLLHSPAPLSNSASDSRRLLRPPASLSNQLPTLHRTFDLPAYRPIHLRLAPAFHRSVLPSDRPLTCVSYRILRLPLRTDSRLASSIAPSGSAFQPTSDSSSDIASLTSLPTDHRLAPATDLPSLPSD